MKLTAIAAMLAFSITGSAAIKVFIQPIASNYPSNEYTLVDYYDTTSMSFVWQKVLLLPKDNSILTINDGISWVRAQAYTEAAVKGYSITDADFITSFPIGGFVTSSTPSYTNPTRTLNSAFRVSTTRASRVSYAVSIACTLSLVTGQSGTTVLEYADDSGFTTNVVTVQSSINANTGSLTVGLNLTQTITASLTGDIPAGKYVRLRTVNNTGTPTFTFMTAQEVLL